MSTRTGAARFHLDRDGARLELRASRDGLRTRVEVLRGDEPVGEATGLGPVLVPIGDEPVAEADVDPQDRRPTVFALAPLPGLVSRAVLLVPRAPEEVPGAAVPAEVVDALPAALARFATATRHEFAPPPGSVAARLAVFRRDHPRLWAARHVVLAVLKVGLALLGVAAFLRLLVAPVLQWLRSLLPDLDLPAIPWPDIDLPDIPWPDLDLPDLHPPAWVLVLLGTAKFWVPILVAVAAAAVEVRRRRRRNAAREDDEASGTHG